MRWIIRLSISVIVASAAFLFLARNGSIPNLSQLQALATGGWARSAIGDLSLSTPCWLHSVAAPEGYKATAKLFASSEFLQGQDAGCTIMVQHVHLANGREAYTLDREIVGKFAELGNTRGGGPMQETAVLVSGARAERATCSLAGNGAPRRMNRLTIAKNRDIWAVAVVSAESNTANTEVFEKIIGSIRL